MTGKKIQFADSNEALAVLGERDEFLQTLTNKFSCKMISRGDFIEFQGEDEEVEKAAQVVVELQNLHKSGTIVKMSDVAAAIKLVKSNRGGELRKMFGETIIVTSK